MPFAKHLSTLQRILQRARAHQNIQMRTNTPLTETRVRYPTTISAYDKPSPWIPDRSGNDETGTPGRSTNDRRWAPNRSTNDRRWRRP